MTIRIYVDKDGDLFTSENVRQAVEDSYWEDICTSFLEKYASYDIVSQLFFDDCRLFADDFTEHEEEYIKEIIKKDYKEVWLEITDEDIVE